MNKDIIIILIIFFLLIIRKNKEHWGSVGGWVSHAAHSVAHTATSAADTVAHTATSAAETVAHTATSAVDTVAHTAVGSAVIDKAERWGPRLLNLAFKSITNPKELLGVLLKQIDCKEIILHLDVKYIIKHMKSVKALRHYLNNAIVDFIWDKSPGIVKDMVNMQRELEDYIETLIGKLVNRKLLMVLGGAAEGRIKYILAKNLCDLIKGEKLELPSLDLTKCPEEFPYDAYCINSSCPDGWIQYGENCSKQGYSTSHFDNIYRCPNEFPHKTTVKKYGNNGLCYNNEKYAKRGWGAPHSWCAFKETASGQVRKEIQNGEGVYCESKNPFRCSRGSNTQYMKCVDKFCPRGWVPFDNNKQCYKKGYSSGKFNNNTYRCSLGNDTRYTKCKERDCHDDICYNKTFEKQGDAELHSWCAFTETVRGPVRRQIERGAGSYCYNTGSENMKVM